MFMCVMFHISHFVCLCLQDDLCAGQLLNRTHLEGRRDVWEGQHMLRSFKKKCSELKFGPLHTHSLLQSVVMRLLTNPHLPLNNQDRTWQPFQNKSPVVKGLKTHYSPGYLACFFSLFCLCAAFICEVKIK